MKLLIKKEAAKAVSFIALNFGNPFLSKEIPILVFLLFTIDGIPFFIRIPYFTLFQILD